MTRISALPRRQWSETTIPDEVVDRVTAALKTPHGEQRLFPVQALALLEWLEGRLFANLPVGGGKTLIALLGLALAKAKRPMLFVPGSLKGKTKRDYAFYRQHWSILPNIRIESYEKLARTPKFPDSVPEDHILRKGFLWQANPDVIACDEAFALRKVDEAACAKKLNRFWGERRPRIMVLGGTLVRDTVLDYMHMLLWTHGNQAPIPLDYDQRKQWAFCLDPDVAERPSLDILTPHLGELPTYTAAVEAYQSRLCETPGVMIGTRSWDGASLYWFGHLHRDPATDKAFRDLRDQALAPDGYPLPDFGPASWGVARQLALGGYYYQDPKPPEEWLAARRTWCWECKEFLDKNDQYDSEGAVVDAIARGQAQHLAGARRDWEAVKNQYDPDKHKKWAWLSDAALKHCEKWGRSRKSGIIWVEFREFGFELSRRTSWPYYANGGLDAAGRRIEDGSGVIIASIDSNFQGRNLQHWADNLVTSFPPENWKVEQLAGRTHRYGQRNDAVTIDFLLGCVEDYACYYRVMRDSDAQLRREGQRLKILTGDHELPKVPVGVAAFEKKRGKSGI